MPVTTDVMLRLLDEDRQRSVSPNFRQELNPGVVRWCSLIEKEIKIKHSAVPAADLAGVVKAEVDRSRECDCALEWQVYQHDRPETLAQVLESQGFRAGDPAAVMVLDLSKPLHCLAHTLDVRRIRDAAALRDYEHVLQLAWSRSEFSEHRAFLEMYLERWPEHSGVFAGYVQGMPVACGRVLLNPGSPFAHLAGGATVPEQRGRGFYSRLVAVRAELARECSARFVSVDASPDSEPVLTKLGFRRVTTVTRWQLRETT
jgi:GNAT superfamily N-acetyltransferase